MSRVVLATAFAAVVSVRGVVIGDCCKGEKSPQTPTVDTSKIAYDGTTPQEQPTSTQVEDVKLELGQEQAEEGGASASGGAGAGGAGAGEATAPAAGLATTDEAGTPVAAGAAEQATPTGEPSSSSAAAPAVAPEADADAKEKAVPCAKGRKPLRERCTVLGLRDADSLPVTTALSFSVTSAPDDGGPGPPPSSATEACPKQTYRLSTGEVLDNFFERYRELLFDIFRVRDSKWYLDVWRLRKQEKIAYPAYVGGEEDVARLQRRNADYDAGKVHHSLAANKGFFPPPTSDRANTITSERLFFHESLDQVGTQQKDLARWMRHLPQMSGAMQMVLHSARKTCEPLTFVHEVLRLSDLVVLYVCAWLPEKAAASCMWFRCWFPPQLTLQPCSASECLATGFVEATANGIAYEMLRPSFARRRALVTEFYEFHRHYGKSLLGVDKRNGTGGVFPGIVGGGAYGYLVFWQSAFERHLRPVGQPVRLRHQKPVQAFATAKVITKEFPQTVEGYAKAAECVERTPEMVAFEERLANYHVTDANFFHIFMEGAADVMKVKIELPPYHRAGAVGQDVNCETLDLDRAWWFYQKSITAEAGEDDDKVDRSQKELDLLKNKKEMEVESERVSPEDISLFRAEMQRLKAEEARMLDVLATGREVDEEGQLLAPSSGEVVVGTTPDEAEEARSARLEQIGRRILQAGKAVCRVLVEPGNYLERVRASMQEMINLVAYTDATWLAQKCFPVLVVNALHAALYTGTELLTALSSGRPWGDTAKWQLLEFQALWDSMLRPWQLSVILPHQDTWAHRSVPQTPTDVGSWAHVISQGYGNLVSVADTILGGFDSRKELAIKGKRSKMSCAGVNALRTESGQPPVCQPLSGPGFDPEAYDAELKEISLRAVKAFRKAGIEEWWPAGGTLIGALRYGSIVGDLGDGRQDVCPWVHGCGKGVSESVKKFKLREEVIDDDVDFVIGVHSPKHWIEVTERVGSILMEPEFGFHDCYVAKSADCLDSKYFANIRDDMLTCGFYEPYYLQLDLRSYVRLGNLNAAYQHRLSGTGYEECDTEEDLEVDTLMSATQRGRVLRFVEHKNFSSGRLGTVAGGAPAAGRPSAEKTSVWKGQMPLDGLLYPLRDCLLYNTTVPCPREAVTLLQLWNAREYENPEQCFALPHLAGRKVDHVDADPRNRKLRKLEPRDVDLLTHYAQWLHDQGFQSFYPLYGGGEEAGTTVRPGRWTTINSNSTGGGGAGKITHCAGLPIARAIGNFDELCPPAKTAKGYSEYLVM
eukprot:g16280.t1